MLTGGSLPLKKAGAPVMAPPEQTGSAPFRGHQVGRETALAQIIRLVEEAQVISSHPKTGRPDFGGIRR